MDASVWILVSIFAVALFLMSLLRRRSGPTKYPEIIQGILWDIRVDGIVAENFLRYPNPKLFEANDWEMNKKKIDFLTESQQILLTETFDLIAGFNREIRAAKKEKSESYKNIDLTQLKDNLCRCRKELEDWMMTNVGTKELPPKYPTISGMFFGER
jgi:hypothetical protein